MTRPVLLGSVLLMLLFSSYALAQATAEAAMGNAAAGNTAAKTGSTLGNAFGKAFDKSAQKLGNAMQTPAQQNPAPATTASTAAPSATPTEAVTTQSAPDAALVQFSVQGSGTSCPAPKDWHKRQAEPSTDTTLTVCSLHAAPGPFPKTKYKPVVDIKF
ncbi:MAG TPA: hypothetical protein VFU86_07680 [Terriglobales bacterium]|nr:hypothetical protein [Terriglobales bacterium]